MLRFVARHGDVVLAVGIVAAVAILVVPLPTGLVDVLLSLSIGGAVALLLTATYVRQPVRFTALPAILLLGTLFRLALNVSTTRLILSEADAGSVIESFGSFVVGGNTVVGAVIFVILTVIQYLVIAKGAERVAEVSARFTLDALPGRQLAIDADLRSGAIGLEEARRLRGALQRESKLYGALDGAMKFVKGDAIAGIIITVVNIAAGLAVGVLQQGMPLDEAVRVYTLLTVGDGLVTQIPAILLATAAGVVVTQVAADDDATGNLARDIGAQIAAHPRALAVTAGLLFVFALLPGLPAAPFGLLAAFFGLIAWRSRSGAAERAGLDAAADAASLRPGSPRLRLRSSPALSDRLGLGAAGDATPDLLRSLVDDLQDNFGLALPPIEIDDQPDPSLEGSALCLDLDGVPLARWSAGDDPVGAEQIAGLLGDAISENLADLVTIQSVSLRIDELAADQPALVEAVVPKRLSLPQLAELLSRLLSEGVSVRSLDRILEVVARESGDDVALPELVERVRRGLSRQLAHAHADDTGTIRAWLVDEPIESMIRAALRSSRAGQEVVLDAEIRDAIVEAMAEVSALDDAGSQPILITQADVRPHLRRLLAARFPRTAVLSFDEVRSAARIESVGQLRVGSA